MESKTIDILSADAVRKYAICMEVEKALIEHGEDESWIKKLKTAEEQWEKAHTAWEESVQAYAEMFNKATT